MKTTTETKGTETEAILAYLVKRAEVMRNAGPEGYSGYAVIMKVVEEVKAGRHK